MEKTKRKRKKINATRMLLAAIIVVLVIVFAVSIKTVVDLHMEKTRLEQENSSLKGQKAELEKELERVNDLSYIEEQARKQLNMVKPGEILYIKDKEDDSSNKDEE